MKPQINYILATRLPNSQSSHVIKGQDEQNGLGKFKPGSRSSPKKKLICYHLFPETIEKHCYANQNERIQEHVYLNLRKQRSTGIQNLCIKRITNVFRQSKQETLGHHSQFFYTHEFSGFVTAQINSTRFLIKIQSIIKVSQYIREALEHH